MTQFEHFAALISIIIGLGLTHLLTNVYRLVVERRRVRPYWLPIVWASVLFVAMVEWWVAFYELRDKVGHWTFFYFLFVLLSPVTLFMAAAFVLPEPGGEEVIDLKQHYYKDNVFFFSMLAAGPALDAIRRGHDAGNFLDFGAVTNAVSALFLASLAFTDRERYHIGVTLFVNALFLYFIVSSLLQLG